MNVTGIIAEYNPFHNGHAYHLAEARRLTNADYVIVVMSGDFVQRGEPAIIDKYARTRMALLGGADLVIELPVRYATGSAEYFAGSAVSILNGLGCVTHLCFGSESGDITPLKNTATLLASESEDYQISLRQELKNGLPFPQAREQALRACGFTESAGLLSSPNNILGVEYIKSLLKLGSSIEPVTIPRKGASYHSLQVAEEICSATAIRYAILQEGSFPAKSVPDYAGEILKTSFSGSFPITADDFSTLLHYQLLMADCWETLASYFDVPDTLAQRIFRLRYDFRDFDSFVSLVKTRNITELSVRRALLHILLQIRKDTHAPLHARVLGFQKTSALLLKCIKENSQIPLIMKPAEERDLLKQDILASQIYHSIVTKKYGAAPFDELRQPLIIL